jgi:hypothetical protein
MEIVELQKMMAEDSQIDTTELATASLNVPAVYSKYLNFVYNMKPDFLKFTRSIKVLRKVKTEYYTGKLSQEELNKYKWEPFQIKIMKSDLDLYLDADQDIQEMQRRIDELSIKIDMIQDFLKMLAARHWTIKNAIDWSKFTNGVI